MIRRAFTLVELLVVITIIGLLVALLLPAVNMARESGRRASCSNNLKQLGTACLSHEEAQGSYPGGGWGSSWVGDPTLGYGRRQPGSWLFSILPGLDNDPLRKLGGSDGITATWPNQMSGAQQCLSTALAFMNCPSRRRGVAYQNGSSYKPVNSILNPNVLLARSDYAANVGNETDTALLSSGPAVTTFKAAGGGLALADQNWQTYYAQFLGSLPNNGGASYGEPNGVIYLGSQCRKDDITDGLTNTILLGEKSLNPNNYTNGLDKGDGKSMYSGCTFDNERSTFGQNGMAGSPIQDRAEIVASYNMFGSAHASSCCFVFCDGSAHWIKYTIDVPTYQCLGCRNDTLTVDTSKL